MTMVGTPVNAGRARCGVSGMAFQMVTCFSAFEIPWYRASLRFASDTLTMAELYAPARRFAGIPPQRHFHDVPSAKHQVCAVKTEGMPTARAASRPMTPAFDVCV